MIKNIVENITVWRGKHIKERQFILLLSFIVGILSGLAAILLKSTIHYTHTFLDKKIIEFETEVNDYDEIKHTVNWKNIVVEDDQGFISVGNIIGE